jgi:hypothetical protein
MKVKNHHGEDEKTNFKTESLRELCTMKQKEKSLSIQGGGYVEYSVNYTVRYIRSLPDI